MCIGPSLLISAQDQAAYRKTCSNTTQIASKADYSAAIN